MPDDMPPFTDNIRPRWWPRVPQEKIRRLYENDAGGIVDEELIDEVGIALLLRCRSILTATAAHEGRAACPRCSSIIPHGWKRNETMTCPSCGWQATWGAYFKTYQDKQLHGGGAMFAFEGYAQSYESARTGRERLLLIDRLIHAFHWEMKENPSRPAACNLIEGTISEIAEFLDTLTYGERTAPEAVTERRAWESKAGRSRWFRTILAEARKRRAGTHDGD